MVHIVVLWNVKLEAEYTIETLILSIHTARRQDSQEKKIL